MSKQTDSSASPAKARVESRKRGRKPYPVTTFAETRVLGDGIIQHGAGHPMKRTTLLSTLKLQNNQATKNLITNSNKYGISQGSHGAEEIKLTPKGKAALDPNSPAKERIQAQCDLAIKGIGAFNQLYERFKGGKVPAKEVMRDALEDIDKGDRAQCVDIFVSNAEAVGLLSTVEGAQHILSVEQVVQQAATSGETGHGHIDQTRVDSDRGNEEAGSPLTGVDFDSICFFVAPIGEDDSEERKHSDAILSSFVEPALKDVDAKLKVVRSDKISKPGMISAQVIEYIVRSKLVVADLSFQNPNVFYELALRHATGKPTVHVIRAADSVPFDIANFRTVSIKMDNVYDLLPKIETYRAEIAQQMRQVLADGVSTNNPILAFCPNGRFVVKD